MDTYLKNILEFPGQLTHAGLEARRLQSLAGTKFDGIVVVGMGGSGLPGEMIRELAGELGIRVPIALWKNYGLPDARTLGMKSPLYVLASFSGNTEETVSGLKALRGRPGKAAVITTGGALLRGAEVRQLPLAAFAPGELTPRQATGRMFYGLTEILFRAGLIPKRPKTFEGLSPAPFRSAGRALAKKIHGRLILFYTDFDSRHLGYFWKIRMNETAKTQAFAHSLPEMNHNEIVSFEKPVVRSAAIFIKGTLGARMAKRLRINEALLRQHGVLVHEIPLTGSSALERTWNSIMLADWAAYYLAELNKVEPGPVPIVERLKKMMQR